MGCSHAQNPRYVHFIKSFKEEKSVNILNFAKVVQIKRPMTKEDALRFVYNGDTSKLFCIQKVINMETEKTEGFSRELYLPSKCFRVKLSDCSLIAYSSYLCQNPNELLKVVLNILIIDENYTVKENMIVYKGSDYESEITGLLNPRNGNIFLIGDIMNIGKKQARLYKIGSESKKFEQIKGENNLNGATDDLMELLKSLEWEESFMN